MAEKKKEKKEVEMTKIEVEKLACMKAERDSMRLTIRNQEYEIQKKCKELEETKGYAQGDGKASRRRPATCCTLLYSYRLIIRMLQMAV